MINNKLILGLFAAAIVLMGLQTATLTVIAFNMGGTGSAGAVQAAVLPDMAGGG